MPHSGSENAAVRLFGFCTVRVRCTADRGRREPFCPVQGGEETLRGLPNVKKYTLKRIITSLFTLLAILLVLFILMQLMPGSPFNDEKLTPEMRASLYAKYGLDQPIYVQFFRYVTNMLRGDFGVSYNISKNTPISQLIQSRLPISIRVGGMAVTLGAIVGLVLGIIAALKRDTIFDTLATIISVIGVSVPSYVIALALSYTFGFKLKWFPMLFSRKGCVRLQCAAQHLAVHVHHGFHCPLYPQ